MHLLFSSNHVQLLNACYPPSPALLTAGPDYSPKSQELSRLTYYALNHPGKLNKLGSELEKRLKAECRKAKAGNTRTRASLLISLSIFRALAVECRRDISLLSPPLVSAVNVTLSSLHSDLEVVARAASVFAAWTTYTDGHLIGADASLTKDYISILQMFSSLSSIEIKDQELRNRTRLIGFAALTGALNSEALYSDSLQFRAQVATIMRPILRTLLEADVSLLDEQSNSVKEVPMTPYLAEFRRRPAIERRAASIHVHVDGEKGPANSDVSSACLHALYSLLEHANGAQLGHIMRSSFDSLDELNGWPQVDHCCWFAKKSAEWASYQYRYAIPTCLVERLLENQDVPTISLHGTLAAMLKSVFTSPTPLINLSTSDINSNLISILMRRTRIDPQDRLLPALVDCIASLGCHIYYSDQIQDLAAEIISRISFIENRSNSESAVSEEGRSQSIRCLLAGLLGLIQAADEHENHEDVKRRLGAMPATAPTSSSPPKSDTVHQDGSNQRPSRRTKVPPDIWQDTLSLLSSQEFAVRADYAQALVFYVTTELPKFGDGLDPDGVKRGRRLDEGPLQHAANLTSLLNPGDLGVKLLNATHAFLYTILTSTASETGASPLPSPSPINIDAPQVRILPGTPAELDQENDTTESPGSHNQSSNGRRSMASSKQNRSRKFSLVLRLLQQQESPGFNLTFSDYSNILLILITLHEQLPARALITGIPMLLALEEKTRADNSRHINRVLIAKVWLTIAKVWDSPELSQLAEKVLSSVPQSADVPIASASPAASYRPSPEPSSFPNQYDAKTRQVCPAMDAEAALRAISVNKNVQEATGLDEQGLLRRLSHQWTPDAALRNSSENDDFDSVRGDAISPLLRISPALMHIENVSLQSLARSTRGVGVTDLREALEGRSSMSNPALVRPSSISTLDHTSSIAGESRHYLQSRPRSRSAPKKKAIPSKPGEVKDVLNRLGIGKQNGSLLKSSFPALPKPDPRSTPRQT
ncbi:hypothetical protein HGRIS_009455 [Hohenbuehelia grisea]|uniref:Protein EFR3 n=1 Tax=Hohenbuehelia grisea TaxID=104357 RepID=A0ABR3J1M2_9AGAR